MWSGRVCLGPYWMLYVGPVGPTAAHAHHAFQIVVSGAQIAPAPSAPEAWLVIPPDCPHAVTAASERALILYVDPESLQGRQLGKQVTGARPPGPIPRVEDGVVPVVDAILAHLGVASVAPRLLHPGVRRVVALLPQRITERPPPTLRELALVAGVSESRLSHLFASDLGLGVRAYVRWLRLHQAAHQLARGASLTDAAHAAGFSDGAHLTRTFRTMFGITPSVVSGFATWTVV